MTFTLAWQQDDIATITTQVFIAHWWDKISFVKMKIMKDWEKMLSCILKCIIKQPNRQETEKTNEWLGKHEWCVAEWLSSECTHPVMRTNFIISPNRRGESNYFYRARDLLFMQKRELIFPEGLKLDQFGELSTNNDGTFSLYHHLQYETCISPLYWILSHLFRGRPTSPKWKRKMEREKMRKMD